MRVTRHPGVSRDGRVVPLDWICFLRVHLGLHMCPPDTPSSPSIDQVEPYSSTAQVQFDEPEATGGVPILKYKAEWRAVGEEAWHFKWYDAKEGKSARVSVSLGIMNAEAPSTRLHTRPCLPVWIG